MSEVHKFLTKGLQTLSLLKQSWPSAINASQFRKCWNQLGRLRYCWRQNRSDWKFRTSAITYKRFGQAEGQSQTDNCLQTQLEILWYSHWEPSSGFNLKSSNLKRKCKDDAVSYNLFNLLMKSISFDLLISKTIFIVKCLFLKSWFLNETNASRSRIYPPKSPLAFRQTNIYVYHPSLLPLKSKSFTQRTQTQPPC